MMRSTVDQLIKNSEVKFGTSGVRGPVSQLTNQVCCAYAKAFIALQSSNSATTTVLIGHDLRPSSPHISSVIAKAAIDSGWEVIYGGALPTPALAYYSLVKKLPAIVVTGSHIPFDRNGIKFYSANGEITKADESYISNAQVNLPELIKPWSLPATEKGVEQSYIRRYTSFFPAGCLKNMKVAIYAHSSVGTNILQKVLEALGAEVLILGKTDSFVPIDTEAVSTEDKIRAKDWARKHKFDAIISTDGDADRPLIGDENGRWLRGDIVGILCAENLGVNTVVTPISSNTAVEKCGTFSKVVRTRIGSPYVIEGMADAALDAQKTIGGYEANGGFLLGSTVSAGNQELTELPTRDAVLPILSILANCWASGTKVSTAAEHLPSRYTASDRLKGIDSMNSMALIEELQQSSTELRDVLSPNSGAIVEINRLDGLRVTFSNADILHLRPSGNAPELRCYTESDSEASAEKLCEECLSRVQSTLERDSGASADITA